MAASIVYVVTVTDVYDDYHKIFADGFETEVFSTKEKAYEYMVEEYMNNLNDSISDDNNNKDIISIQKHIENMSFPDKVSYLDEMLDKHCKCEYRGCTAISIYLEEKQIQ